MKNVKNNQEEFPFSAEELRAILRTRNRQRLRQELATMMDEEDAKEQEAEIVPLVPKKRKIKPLWLAAASIAILLGFFAIWMWFNPSYSSAQEMALDFKTAIPIQKLDQDLSSPNEQLEAFSAALKRKDVQTAHQILEGFPSDFIKIKNLRLVFAYHCFNAENYDCAILVLDQHLTEVTKPNEAYKLLIVSYIGANRLEEAKETLNRYKKQKNPDTVFIRKIEKGLESLM